MRAGCRGCSIRGQVAERAGVGGKCARRGRESGAGWRNRGLAGGAVDVLRSQTVRTYQRRQDAHTRLRAAGADRRRRGRVAAGRLGCGHLPGPDRAGELLGPGGAAAHHRRPHRRAQPLPVLAERLQPPHGQRRQDRPEASPLRPLPGARPRLLRQEPDGRRGAHDGRGHREAGDLLRAVPVADHRLGRRSGRHLRLHGDPGPGDRHGVHRLRGSHPGASRTVPQLEQAEQLPAAPVVRRARLGLPRQRAGSVDAQGLRAERSAREAAGGARQGPLQEHDGGGGGQRRDQRCVDLLHGCGGRRRSGTGGRARRQPGRWSCGRCS